MRRTLLDDAPGEFPRIDERRAGLPYRHAFRVSRAGDAEAILRHDLHRRTRSAFVLQEGERTSEAVFVPRADGAPEGDGWLLALLWRPEPGDSVFAVLDAQRLEDGPVATVPLPRRVPFGFHGSWVPAAA